MSLLDYFRQKRRLSELKPLDLDDDAVVAVTDGELFEVSALPDPMFAEKMLGDSVALRARDDKAIVCSPANGVIRALFPTGHAFGVVRDDGVELLVHCGIDTVEARGEGFTVLKHVKGDRVKAGEPIVVMDQKQLGEKYDTSIILIITDKVGRDLEFIKPQEVTRGTSLIR